ncbi:MAG: polysaccharide deacetylase family protein (PEP-CTERM system associated) [Cocleimonas sp.]|jgi:polysaccharide deacetylase family protein (PEP-CTERM system associated)
MIFSVDVEDWCQSVLDNNNPVTDRVLNSTLRLLDLLEEHDQKATFFTLGNVAAKHPELIRKIVDNGHEIASHGYNHHSIFNLSPKQVREDVGSSVKILEDISGKKVIGFRAPDFSIREYLFEWYCEALAENGLKYDSSLFPMKVIKYGIEKEYSLKIFNKYHLNEHYLSYMKVSNMKLPFFGGGYFRITPYFLTKHLSKKLNQGRAVFYMHPYELDTEELSAMKREFNHIPLKWRLSQFVGRNTIENKLHKLLSENSFTSFEREYYAEDSASIPRNTLSNLDHEDKESTYMGPENIVAKTYFSS